MNGSAKAAYLAKQVYDPYPVSGEVHLQRKKARQDDRRLLSNLFVLITGIVSQLDIGAGGGYVIRRVVKSPVPRCR